MAELGWSILCRRLIVDQETKLATIVDCVDKLQVNAEIDGKRTEDVLADAKDRLGADGIQVPVDFLLCMWWIRSDYAVPELASGRLELISPSGKVVKTWNYPVNLEANIGYRIVLQLQDFQVSTTGVYFFAVSRVEEGGAVSLLARSPIDVEIVAILPSVPPPLS